MSITRIPTWLDIASEKLFFWQHVPSAKNKSTVVIIIGAVGPEYMHCFRSIKLLADTVAKSGFFCVRYDPIGMGDSSGDLEDKNIWTKWLESPSALFNYLSQQYGFDNAILIGLRSGSLIVSECINNLPLKAAVLWYPYTRGAAFIRDIELLDSMLYKDKENKANKILDGGGYPVTRELRDSIIKINLLTQQYSNLPKALLIASKETTNKSKLHDKLLAQNIDCNIEYLEGLDAMTKQVAISKIPYTNIETIGKWLNNLEIISKKTDTKILESTTIYTTDTYTESMINITNPRPIFGVLTTPKIVNNTHIVVIANTGSAHHVGPNRFHVEAARNFTQKGISTLRIDISNLGDSVGNHNQDSNHPYPSTAAEDINIVVNFIQTELKYKNITLCGLCSGAHNVFHAALQSNCTNLHKIIIINPLTFYWQPGQSIFAPDEHKTSIDESYYQQQLYSYKKWINLITNPRKLLNIVLFISRFIYAKTVNLIKNLLVLFGAYPKTKLENDFSLLAEKKISILLIHSENDPGYKIIMSQAFRIFKKLSTQGLFSIISISDADHTFSSRTSRSSLIKALLKNTL